ncbi:Germin-like protein subfamily 1 member [Thalictrum thalictroides]|uniref:Germin-like protein n=1 Tax=Thalictrum thalictroides TaxID=46969 RepID=A0A7J6XCW4_THATH|nr:Germin-like protein subfamily 1 member [Thalictrum thalictroides]
MMVNNILRLLSLLAFACSFPFAVEPSPLQDFCVADYSSPVFVNGFACKDPNLADGTDFFYSGLHLPGNTSNFLGSDITPVNAAHIPGLNTLGISMVRIDYAQGGLSPPHTHPRASEILTVLEGTLFVGFITSNPENRLITKVLQRGDVFVFPVGLIHFQRNIGYGNAVAFAAFSSQNPGAVTVANTVFGANPRIETDILTRAFAVDNSIIDSLQLQF